MKSNRLSEGQTGTVLLVSVVLGVLLSGFVALAFTQQLPDIYGRYVNDAGVITEAEARNDMLEKNYFPLAAHYSFAQGAYEAGQYSGFTDIVYGFDDSYDDVSERSDEMDVYESMINDAEYEANNVFDDYLNEYQFKRCKVDMSSNADVDIGLESTWVNVSTPDDQLVNVSCMTNQMKVNYEGSKDEFGKKAVNNRYHKMTGILVKGLRAAENVTEKIEKYDNMRGTVTSNATCTFDNQADARDAAESNAEDEAAEILIQIGKAIIDQVGGINRDNNDDSDNRGAEHAIEQETKDNELCLFGRCITIQELDIVFRTLEENIYVESNQTQINQQSTNAYRCGCTNWECNYNDGDSEEEFEANDDDSTSVITESDEVSCVFQKSDVNDYPGDPSCTNYDFSHDGFGGCTLDETPPDVCDVGSWNGTHCDDGGTIGSTTYCDENDVDDEFSRSGYSCVHDDAPESPECQDDDLQHDGSGGCEFNDQGNEPVPTCPSSNERYNADSTYYYEMDRITGMIRLIDDEIAIPVNDGFTHLEVARKYRRFIPDDPEH